MKGLKLFLWVIMTTLTLPVIAAESSTLIPRTLLFGNVEKSSPKISPDGKKLAYLAPDDKNVLNVWVQDLQGTSLAQKVTADEKRGIRMFMWQLDSEHLIYLQDHEGDENWHMFQTDIQAKATKELTPFKGVMATPLEYDYKFPNEMLIQMNKRSPEVFDVYKLDLQTGNITLDTENPGDVFHWAVDHDLKVRVAQSYGKDGSTIIRVRDSDQAPWRDFLSIDPLESGGVVEFTPDNQGIYFQGNLGGNTERLYKMNLIDGKRELIFEDPNYDIEDIIINAKTYIIEAIGFEKDRYELVVFDDALKPDFQYLTDALKTPFVLTSRDKAEQNWIVASTSDQRPVNFYLFNRPTRKLTFLFSTRPALEKYPMSPMEPVSFQARDGMKLHGYLTLPVGKDPKNLPTILLVHGGPWVRDYWGFDPQVQWLANRGYAVFQINYRGSQGYGKVYLNAGNREWGRKMQTDLIDGKNWLIEKGYTDPNKVALYGGSYGGYATLAGLAFTPDEFCCGVDIVGPSNLITLLNTFPPYWLPLKAKADIQLGDPIKDADELISRSPLHKADQIKKPLLIGQGANDPRVKQAESDQIVEAMRKNHLPVVYLLFSDEGHGFARPENRLKFNAAAEEFLSTHLGGRYEPASKEENWDSFKR